MQKAEAPGAVGDGGGPWAGRFDARLEGAAGAHDPHRGDSAHGVRQHQEGVVLVMKRG